MQTAFTRLLGCPLPLQQAAMGGIATVELAAAVARAGGLGMLSQYDPEPVAPRIEQTLDRAGGGDVGMSFFGWALSYTQADLELAAARLRVVEVFWGDPTSAVVDQVRRAGPALVCWQVGSADEALAAAAAGCDLVAVQGVEAGGHVRGTLPLMALLDQVLPRLDIPVVAAGGIGTARSAAAAFAAGAAAVRVGTRLVATEESVAHPDYVAALLRAEGEDTVLTTAFHGGWEDAPHRVLRSAVDTAAALPDGPVATMQVGDARHEVPRWSATPPDRRTSGRIDAMALYAGCGVGSVVEVGPAEAVVVEIVSGAERLLTEAAR